MRESGYARLSIYHSRLRFGSALVCHWLSFFVEKKEATAPPSPPGSAPTVCTVKVQCALNEIEQKRCSEQYVGVTEYEFYYYILLELSDPHDCFVWCISSSCLIITHLMNEFSACSP